MKVFIFNQKIITKEVKSEAAYLDTTNDNKDIFEKLYNQALRQKQEKEKNANRLFFEINYGNKPDINSETDLIYNKIKKDVFSKIFKILDYDYDEVITGDNIFIGFKKLESELKKIIEPLAIQLRDENETLIESEFIRAMEDLYELSSYNDKRILIDYYKKIKNKSLNQILFERSKSQISNFNIDKNNNSRKNKEEEKYFDEHLSWNIIEENALLNNKKHNDNAISNSRQKNLNNSFSFKVLLYFKVIFQIKI